LRDENAVLRNKIADLESLVSQLRGKNIELTHKNAAFFEENQRLRKTVLDRESRNKDLYSIASELATENEKLRLRLASSKQEIREKSQSLSLMCSLQLSEIQRTASKELESIRRRLSSLKANSSSKRPEAVRQSESSGPKAHHSPPNSDGSSSKLANSETNDRSLSIHELR